MENGCRLPGREASEASRQYLAFGRLLRPAVKPRRKTMALLFIVLLPLLGGLLPVLLARPGSNRSAWAAAVVAGGSLALALHSAPAVFAGQIVHVQWPWFPSLGLQLSFMMDGLGLLFALLVLGIGLLVVLYARYYLPSSDPMGRFYGLLLLFMASMLGVVLSANILLLLVFWELTSVSSFLLIGYWNHQADARQGARMALTVTGGGGLALLAGFLLLGHIAGSFELPVILQSGALIQSSPLYVPSLVLILLGAFTKSAQFPFHFWLPSAMSAPTPVSAYLHSATMVKAGVFLLARLFPALSGTDPWFYLVSTTGLVTLLFGAYIALFKHDLKGLLAYSTISNLGLITLLFGMGTPLAAVAGVFHIINHATFKASLFMAAGIIDHEAGTRDMRKLNGLWPYMPHTATLAMVAAAAMAGVPLLNGFLSKEMFFAETLVLDRLGNWDWVLAALVTLAGLFTVAYSIRFIHDVFFNGEPVDLPRVPHEPPRYMKIPVEVLVGTCLLVGIVPGYTVAPVLAVAASGTLRAPLPEYGLDIWHGLSVPLAMSAIALVVGTLVYSQRQHLFQWHDRNLPHFNGWQLYHRALGNVIRLAQTMTSALENGSLQRYLAWLVAAALVAGAAPFVASGGLARGSIIHPPDLPLDAITLIGWLILLVAAVAAVLLHRQRLTAVIMLGVVGLMVALTFARFSAPDLALTQLSVEVVTIVLMLLSLYFLPQETPRESGSARRLRDSLLALLAGLGTAGLTWGVLSRPQDSISKFYLEQSVPGGGGANVVNVILVDFRGFDTMGEIVVLAIAAIAIYAILDGLRVPHQVASESGQPWAADRYPLVLAVTARLLLPIGLLVAVYLFLRGHNQPGGGFIAAVVTATAFIMQYLASGTRWTQRRLSVRYRPLIGAGLLVTVATGIGSWFFGMPFLTSAHGHVYVPLLGYVELATAMLFDLGVLLTVTGAVTLILARIGRISGDEPPALNATFEEEPPQWKS
jgi:multicomponent K+:H+ antiporter subunit A